MPDKDRDIVGRSSFLREWSDVLRVKSAELGERTRRNLAVARQSVAFREPFFTQRRELFARILPKQVQSPPFEHVHRYAGLMGERDINNIVDTTLDKVKDGDQQFLVIAGPPASGKTEFLKNFNTMINAKGITEEQVAFVTIEEALADVSNYPEDRNLTPEIFNKASKRITEKTKKASETKNLIVIETPTGTGIPVNIFREMLSVPPEQDDEEIFGMDRGTSSLMDLFGPESPFRDKLASVIYLVPPPEFPERLVYRRKIDEGVIERTGPGGTRKSSGDAQMDIKSMLFSKPFEGVYAETSVADLLEIQYWMLTDQKYPIYRGPIVGIIAQTILGNMLQLDQRQVFIGESRGALHDFRQP